MIVELKKKLLKIADAESKQEAEIVENEWVELTKIEGVNLIDDHKQLSINKLMLRFAVKRAMVRLIEPMTEVTEYLD